MASKTSDLHAQVVNAGRKERGPDGRFLPGWSGGPGRPTKRREERFIDLLDRGISDHDFMRILRTQVRAAIAGDEKAAALILKYCLPLPERKIEVSTGEGGEIRVAGITPDQFNAQMLERLSAIVNRSRARQRQANDIFSPSPQAPAELEDRLEEGQHPERNPTDANRDPDQYVCSDPTPPTGSDDHGTDRPHPNRIAAGLGLHCPRSSRER